MTYEEKLKKRLEAWRDDASKMLDHIRDQVIAELEEEIERIESIRNRESEEE